MCVLAALSELGSPPSFGSELTAPARRGLRKVVGESVRRVRTVEEAAIAQVCGGLRIVGGGTLSPHGIKQKRARQGRLCAHA